MSGSSYYKFRKWNNNDKREKILRKFSDLKQEIKLEYEKISQVDLKRKLPVLSENDTINIELLSDKEQSVFYKAKVDFLTSEFSKSNLFFLRIFLPLTEQMLKMNKPPTDLFDVGWSAIELWQMKTLHCLPSAKLVTYGILAEVKMSISRFFHKLAIMRDHQNL